MAGGLAPQPPPPGLPPTPPVPPPPLPPTLPPVPPAPVPPAPPAPDSWLVDPPHAPAAAASATVTTKGARGRGRFWAIARAYSNPRAGGSVPNGASLRSDGSSLQAPSPPAGASPTGPRRWPAPSPTRSRAAKVGPALSAYQRGVQVVDLWGGLAGTTTGRAWERDTRIVVSAGGSCVEAPGGQLTSRRAALPRCRNQPRPRAPSSRAPPSGRRSCSSSASCRARPGCPCPDRWRAPLRSRGLA